MGALPLPQGSPGALHSLRALEGAKKEVEKIFCETGGEREGNATGSSTWEGFGGSSSSGPAVDMGTAGFLKAGVTQGLQSPPGSRSVWDAGG